MNYSLKSNKGAGGNVLKRRKLSNILKSEFALCTVWDQSIGGKMLKDNIRAWSFIWYLRAIKKSLVDEELSDSLFKK